MDGIMLLRRRSLVAGLAGALAGLAAAGQANAAGAAAAGLAAAPGAADPPEDDLLQQAQYGYYGPRRRRPNRCWIERRRVPVRDAWGRVRYRWTDVRVCRR
jgi:hypothetical protein